MRDISNETSMEDILSSIKRIIADDGEGAPSRSASRRQRRSADASDEDERAGGRDPADAVLELREAIAEAGEDALARSRFLIDEGVGERAANRALGKDDAAGSGADSGKAEEETIVSRQAADASRGKLESLSRMVVKPETPGSDTLEGMVREMLRPMLREWMDANLPGLVERMVQREIERITERGS